jgi:hypothetical protein
MMGLQKFRFDKSGMPEPNGSIPMYADHFGGSTLAGVQKCPIESFDVVRTVYAIGEPDTFFSVPAKCKVNGMIVTGFISHDEDGYKFTGRAK